MGRLLTIVRGPALREWPEIVVVAMVGLVVEVGLRTATLPRLSRWLGAPLADGPDEALAPGSLRAAKLDPRAERQWRAVGRVTRHWPVASTGLCLRVALIGGQRLRRLEPRLRVGVAKVDGKITAHAWLEIGDRCLDPLGASQYFTLGPVRRTTEPEPVLGETYE